MSIGLWQVDGTMPNLALMKLSAYLKALGKGTHLQTTPDHTTAYGSLIFTRNRLQAEFWLRAYPDIAIGGSGWNLKVDLSTEIEAMHPDYELYDIDYGLGFMSRGCIRNCPFCIVREKEGHLRQVAGIADLLNPRSNFLILLDNNLLALPNAVDILCELAERQLTVNFNQGLDIRLVTPTIARALSRIHYTDRLGNNRTLYFAWDNIREEEAVRRGLHILFEGGIPAANLCIYVLAGFGDQTLEDVLYRCNVLREYGIRPYVMRYRRNLKLNAIARWANSPTGLWRKPFSEYSRAND